jgi:hypothetical protein
VDVGCGDDGSFVLAKFEDQYCQTPTGGISNTLDRLNKKIKKLANVCESAYDAGGNFVLGDLLQYSESCLPLDNVMCGDDNGSKMATYKSNSSGHSLSSDMSSQLASSLKRIGKTVKYALGSCFLLASFIMFLGILMMNRRKRRANLNHKFREGKSSSNSKLHAMQRHTTNATCQYVEIYSISSTYNNHPPVPSQRSMYNATQNKHDNTTQRNTI